MVHTIIITSCYFFHTRYDIKNTTRAVMTAVIINVTKKVIAIAPSLFTPSLFTPSLFTPACVVDNDSHWLGSEKNREP